MKNKSFRKFYLLSLLSVFLASVYPIYMGISIVIDMIRFGTVYAEDYPKYVIPYTPIVLSLLIGVALIPVAMKIFKKYALWAGTAFSTAVFFASELMLERMVIVTKTASVSKLEAWQMAMCYIPPNAINDRTWTEVDVLMGEYSPAFKLHFYIISLILIISFLNCFYGFAKMIASEDYTRKKSLVIQSVASGAFLGMCIWACFTAFYRDGAINISPLSATLMIVFFILMGVTSGVYVSSFTIKKKKSLSVVLPSIVSASITLIMYIGEMILLSGHLYRFGNGIFFRGIDGIVLAPVDIIVIILSGVITAMISYLLCEENNN